jgi:cyclopropane fatty-acyl-phospholipid synthase-like methyltransferase
MPDEKDDTVLQAGDAGYWDAYYARASGPGLPSQFATFVAGELDRHHRIVEFGCGNGRDAMFFAAQGHQVVGIDAAEPAIKRCHENAQALGHDADFVAARIDDPELADKVPPADGATVVYARFFLHAITEQEERAFFRCARALTKPGDLMAVEFRTTRDRTGEKVTERHFRRFLEPVTFQLDAFEHGFRTTYSVEGFGFAKYKQDDAHVARCLLVRQG